MWRGKDTKSAFDIEFNPTSFTQKNENQQIFIVLFLTFVIIFKIKEHFMRRDGRNEALFV